MKKSTKVKEIKRRNAELSDDTDAQTQVIAMERAANRVKNYSKVTDQVAQSDLWVRNEPIPFAKDIWPHDWKYQYADLYYPNAMGGGIYMDIPGAPYEETMCEEKHRELSAKGVRYTYLKSNEGEAEMLSRLPHLVMGEPQRKEAMI